MLAYVDSSVLLRIVLHEENFLREFVTITRAVSSELIRVETLRTMDRIRIQHSLSEDQYLERIDLIHEFLTGIELIKISEAILKRAWQPFPSTLGTLDAIHLATCSLFLDNGNQDVILCTHDQALKKATKALGIPVLG